MMNQFLVSLGMISYHQNFYFVDQRPSREDQLGKYWHHYLEVGLISSLF